MCWLVAVAYHQHQQPGRCSCRVKRKERHVKTAGFPQLVSDLPQLYTLYQWIVRRGVALSTVSFTPGSQQSPLCSTAREKYRHTTFLIHFCMWCLVLVVWLHLACVQSFFASLRDYKFLLPKWKLEPFITQCYEKLKIYWTVTKCHVHFDVGTTR